MGVYSCKHGLTSLVKEATTGQTNSRFCDKSLTFIYNAHVQTITSKMVLDQFFMPQTLYIATRMMISTKKWCMWAFLIEPGKLVYVQQQTKAHMWI